MDWNDLRHFLAVARTGSLSAAARQVGGSAATVGRRIQALEASLGLILFERFNTGYVLTPDGREIQVRAEAAEQAVLSVARAADGGRPSGSVRVATGEALAAWFIAPALTALKSRHPALRVELVTGPRTVSLTRREADLALRMVRPDQGDQVRRNVGRLGFGLYAAPLLLAQRSEAERADPWNIDVVGWDESMRDLSVARWLREPALSRVVATATSTAIHLSMARAGLGAAILPCLVADAEPGLVRLAGPAEVGSLDLWLVAHRDLSRTPRVRATLDFLADLCHAEAARLRGD